MTAADVTVGELFRALGKVEKAVEDGFRKVDEQIANLRTEFVSREVFDLRVGALEEQVEKSTDSRRFWLTTGVAVVAMLVAILVPVLS